jgi:hypothetical protein
MPNISQLPVLNDFDVTSTSTYFLSVDNRIAKRIPVSTLNIIAHQEALVVSDSTFTRRSRDNRRIDPPLSSTATGSVGNISFDDTYIYLCVAEDTWLRVPASTF